MSLHPLQTSVNVASGSWNNTPIHGVMKYQDQNMSHISGPLCWHDADKGQRKTQKQPQTEIYRWTCNRQPAGHPEAFITCWLGLWIPPVKFDFLCSSTKGKRCAPLFFLLTWTNCWMNIIVASDLRYHDAHVTSLKGQNHTPCPIWNHPKTCCCLTHWGRVTHICVSKQTLIGSDNGLSPGRRQAIIWINVRILLIGTLGTNFGEILIKIRIFSFKKIGLKVPSAKWLPFCLGLNVLTNIVYHMNKYMFSFYFVLLWLNHHFSDDSCAPSTHILQGCFAGIYDFPIDREATLEDKG